MTRASPRADPYFLAVGQPAGLAAFADAGAVLCSPRRFAAAELEPNQPADAWLDCMVSLHRLEDESHFCVAHRWGELSPGARDQFRNIASILARQAIIYLLPEAAALFAARQASPAQREVIREVNRLAGTFRFYRHALPWRDLAEAFCRVDMGWDGWKYVDPDFSAAVYGAVPEVLRMAVDGEGGKQALLF